MSRRILIDATHPEETRVAIVDKRLEDFDFETSTKKQIKGNIYLAKVTRVEPSLQAAFVEYGGNRQGFLPFSEIHQDYYHIPTSDSPDEKVTETNEQVESIIPIAAPSEEDGEVVKETPVETLDDDEDERPERPNLYRRYKIQEVVRRNQIILVQVIKEERGNKGASLTTYISLAGRFCVLMPNSDKGGGVSRRIEDSDDRNRLKDVLDELEIPQGMSVIIRTAGEGRSKPEVRRDYDYLLKLWNSIRELTLTSTAPAMIYEEGDLIKRYIRDRYDNTISEILIEGEKAYNSALEFMRIMMPNQVENIKKYEDSLPIFNKFEIEEQLNELYDNKAFLRSGGYIVINPTEALVSIDVNSGRSTRERNVEETALKTNIEAAHEIARQVRLRDLAGLIVIDFIDMMDGRNRRTIERVLRDALEEDRARIQIGRISPFGLLEMSRQRLRSSILEASTITCPHCNGIGVLRSPESTVVNILRSIEVEADRGLNPISVITSVDVATYTLNHKRAEVDSVENRYNTKVIFKADSTVIGHNYVIEGAEEKPKPGKKRGKRRLEESYDDQSSSEAKLPELANTPSVIDPMTVAPEALESFKEENEQESSGQQEDQSGDEAPRRGRKRIGRGGPRRSGNYQGEYNPRRRNNSRPRNGHGGGRRNRYKDDNRRGPRQESRPQAESFDTAQESTAPRVETAQIPQQTSLLKHLWRRITE